jgi:hypothetical protein
MKEEIPQLLTLLWKLFVIPNEARNLHASPDWTQDEGGDSSVADAPSE